tara:strand:+ start:2659 stop:2817 length:159 start_codon:yes stop_codon:yes gene_type:complete
MSNGGLALRLELRLTLTDLDQTVERYGSEFRKLLPRAEKGDAGIIGECTKLS